MTLQDRLARIAAQYADEPYFRLVYVGDDDGRQESVRRAAESIGVFESIQAISRNELRERRMDLGVVHLRGCLVQVWDLAGEPADESIDSILRRLPLDAVWSPQTFRFGLISDAQELRFRDFIEAIDKDFAAVGDLTDVAGFLGTWCGPGSLEDPRKLRMPTTKLPSEWLGSLKHDYFGNVIPLIRRRTAELNTLLKGNDFWHDTARNVLRFPFENSPARTFGIEEGDRASDIELIRRIASAPFELVVPPWLEPSLIEAGWERGVEYSVYANKDEAEAILGGPAERGQKRILVQDLEIVPVDEAPESFPRVIAGDRQLRMSWRGWNEALATNILGAFSRSDFETTPMHGCLPVVKASYWKALCFVALPESIELILEPMFETYEWLETQGEGSTNDSLRRSLFQCIAQVWHARGLYFGDSSARARMNQERS